MSRSTANAAADRQGQLATPVGGGISPAVAIAITFPRNLRVVAVAKLGDAKIDQTHMAGAVEQQVLRLEVPIQHPA